jgi:hypothetical protein
MLRGRWIRDLPQEESEQGTPMAPVERLKGSGVPVAIA